MNGEWVENRRTDPLAHMCFAVLPDLVPGPAILVDAAPCFHPLTSSAHYARVSWLVSPERYLVGRSFNSVPSPGWGEDDDNELISAAKHPSGWTVQKIKKPIDEVNDAAV